MRLVFKLAMLPVIVVLWVLWIIAAIVSRIYSVTHGILWVILLALIVAACVLQMWQNVIALLAIGAASYLVMFALTAVEVLLEAARKMLLA